MKKFIHLVTVIAVIFFVTGCKGPAGRLPGEDDIEISWELIGNNRTARSFFTAEFVIVNKSRYKFDSIGWILYFNQLPRRVIPGSITAEVHIDHVNGDLFRITPADGFRLIPRDTVRIRFDGSGWIIKRIGAPQGLYFVFYDKNNKELASVPVKNYTIKPFPDLEKVFPFMGEAPMPTPEWQYEVNRSTTLLEEDQLKRIIPSPVEISGSDTKVKLGEGLMIHYDEGLEDEAGRLAVMLEKLLGWKPGVVKSSVSAPGIVALKIDEFGVNGRTSEAYRLESSPERGVIITGSDPAGVFYGIQTLLALVPVKIYSTAQPEIEIDAVSISDAPAFGYRGMHLDLARNFNSKSTILKMIEVMSFYKLNYLHLHLTDDEGWRIEIRELHELTDIGGYRGHCTGDRDCLPPAYGSGPVPDPGISYGSGYLSREDFIEILRFADEHHIEVIPEINMPGHARAAIQAMEVRYNRLMEEGQEEEAERFRLIDPSDTSQYSSAQNYNDNVVCVCKESVYSFYEAVVDEIIQMYKEAGVSLTTIHTGGDEVPRGVWEGSPICAQFLRDNHSIESIRDLQAYFFGRIAKILEEHDLVAAGWEEVAMKSLGRREWIPNPEFIGRNVVPYVWNSIGNNIELGYRLANAGYPVVLCNVTNFYFDMAYDHHPQEPGLYWGGYVNTRNAFEFIPFDFYKSAFTSSLDQSPEPGSDFKDMERLKTEARKNIIGLQGQLWSETIKGQEMMEYLYLPKMLGLAERAWVGQAEWGSITDNDERTKNIDEDWNIFANSVGQRELPRLDYIFGGFSYRIPPPGAVIKDGRLHANITFPGLEIRYTTDDSEPTTESTLYENPVSITGSVKLKAFDTRGRGSRTVEVK
jgi:hexosaminidase